MINSKFKNKTMNIVKVCIILTLLTTIAGYRALSEAHNLDKNASGTETKPDSVGDNSNTATATNNDSSNENSSLTTEANTDSSANTEQNNIKPGGNYAVTFNGFGSVKVGMTIAQASQALGAKLVRGKGYEDACFYVDPKGIQGVRFMVTNGKIARIDVSSNKYVTDKGAKIGDTEARIKSLYPGIKVYPQKYDEKKHDLEINSGDKKYLIIFETDGWRITGFRVGNSEEVGYIEGCS